MAFESRLIRIWRDISLLLPSVAYNGMIATNDAVNVAAGAGVVWLLGQIYVHKRFPYLEGALFIATMAASKMIASVGYVALGMLVGVWGLDKLRRRELKTGWQAVGFAGVLAGR